MHNPAGEVIAKPSEVLSGVKAMMDVLQSLENYIHIDISRVFNNVLLYQTQPVDGLTGEHTITHVCTVIILYITHVCIIVIYITHVCIVVI